MIYLFAHLAWTLISVYLSIVAQRSASRPDAPQFHRIWMIAWAIIASSLALMHLQMAVSQ